MKIDITGCAFRRRSKSDLREYSGENVVERKGDMRTGIVRQAEGMDPRHEFRVLCGEIGQYDERLG